MGRAMSERDDRTPQMNFQSILQVDVPKGRDGKHKRIVTQLLSDLAQLQDGSALRIPLTDLPDSKENIRSALNRATRQRSMEVATSSDAEYLYVWKTTAEEA
jgi:TusA-related sulfurtransferase